MDFFEAQDRARRKTWQLVLLFAIAIVGLIIATNVLRRDRDGVFDARRASRAASAARCGTSRQKPG